MPRPLFPPWLRRGFEAAVVAAIVAVASLAGDRLGPAGVPFPFPPGPTGALLLAPAVLALGVLTATYPIAMAATRADAILGAVAAYLVAVDFTIILAGGHISLERLSVVLPTGVLVGLIALAPFLAGLAGSQLGASLGFGRRAGALAAVASGVGAVLALLIVAAVG
jgi:hypothetical protein